MSVVTSLTFGDLIRHHRANAKLSLNDLSRLTNINKGTISKIENEEVKKPEFKTIKTLATALNIPYDEYIWTYIEVERNPDSLAILLEDAIISERPIPLVTQIASKFLQTERIDSYESTNKLFDFTCTVESTEIQLALFKTIINYSRGHGVMPFLARSLYQEYLIERNDFSKLNETYSSGKYILKYKDLLPCGEYATLLYCLAAHSYVIRDFEDCVSYCKILLVNDTEEALKVRSYAIDYLRGSYYHLGNYELAEKYAEEYRRCGPSVESDNDRLLTAMINAKRGNTDLAVEQFEKCLRLCANSSILPTVTEYISLCFDCNHIDKIGNLLLIYECKIHEQIYSTPMERSEAARFYRLKGDYYTQVNDVNQAIREYIEGAYTYACIDDIDNERECLRLVYRVSKQQNLTADVIERVGDYYNRFGQTGGPS